MKPTQEQVIAWAREVGLDDDVHYWSIRLSVVRDLTAIAYEAGRKDENEEVAQMFDIEPPLIDSAKNEHGGCFICGFTPTLAAAAIRARREQ